jgi:hypothetical protein
MQLKWSEAMLMTRQNFQNIRDTIIMANDPLDMDLFLVDYQGFPISLRSGFNTMNLRLSIVSMIGGWWQSVVDPDTAQYNPNGNIYIDVLDVDKSHIRIRTDGGVLNFQDGYNYTVQMKAPADPDSAYKTIARGFIEVFNR